jgi:hypothetical protein
MIATTPQVLKFMWNINFMVKVRISSGELILTSFFIIARISAIMETRNEPLPHNDWKRLILAVLTERF